VVPFRLLVADDHPIVLSGLRLLLAGSSRYVIVAQADSADSACEQALRHQPEIIVTDLVMGGADRIVLIERLAVVAPAAAILVYSSSDEAIWSGPAVQAGARAYVPKAEPLESVAAALDAITAYRPDPPARDATPGIGPHTRAGLDALSPRESQILTLMRQGCSPQQLCVALDLSIKTVGTYRERLKIKLGFDSMRMLDRFAAECSVDGVTARDRPLPP
jgi:DNA-binding NarL/FixJ family response regulator